MIFNHEGPFKGVVPFSAVQAADDMADFQTSREGFAANPANYSAEYLADNVRHIKLPAGCDQCGRYPTRQPIAAEAYAEQECDDYAYPMSLRDRVELILIYTCSAVAVACIGWAIVAGY